MTMLNHMKDVARSVGPTENGQLNLQLPLLVWSCTVSTSSLFWYLGHYSLVLFTLTALMVFSELKSVDIGLTF